MQELQIEELDLYYGQRLSDTAKFKDGTPSNYIIFKELPGIGATHGEILLYLQRHSIIVEVNVPVIVGKQREIDPKTGKLIYPDMLGVYKGVTQAQVEKYLNSSTTPKKIVCTPEAYENKVKPAIVNCKQFNLYSDFFLLLDESDKLTTEVSYRSKIILPLDDFFEYDSKAMISATALTPSDPRFADNGFKILKVVPQFEYGVTLNLVNTNNVTEALRKLIIQYPNEPMFIFVNSTDMIYALVKSLGIEDRTKIFCAPDSVKKLIGMGLDCASSELPSMGEYGKFNIFTSRFFSAVDIKVNYKPSVVMLTNVYKARQTIIDPYTDAIQITGRLRNGITRLAHITNYNPSIKWFKPEEALQYINEGFEEYTKTVERLANAKSQGAIDALKQSLERMEISRFVDDKHRLMTFMVDNHLHEQTVRSLYASKGKLMAAYNVLSYFNISEKDYYFNVSDAQLHDLNLKLGKQELTKTVCELLRACDETTNAIGEVIYNLGQTRSEILSRFPDIARNYDMLGGYHAMEQLDFTPAKIRRAIKKKAKKDDLLNANMSKEIKSWYKVDERPLASTNEAKLQRIYKKYGIKTPAKGTHIQLHYVAHPSTDINNKKVWVIKAVID